MILCFVDHQLDSLPAGFHELRALRCLYLQSNRLREFPHNIGQLTNLEVLFAADNIITSLPDSLAYVRNKKNARCTVCL